MPSEIKPYLENMLDLVKKLEEYKKKERVIGKESYRKNVYYILNELEKANENVSSLVELKGGFIRQSIKKEELIIKEKEEAPLPTEDIPKELKLSKREMEYFLKDLNIKEDEIKDFIKNNQKRKKQKDLIKTEYSIYIPNQLSKFANDLFSSSTMSLLRKYPKFFQKLSDDIKQVDIKVLFRTYVSLMLLFSILAFPVVFLISILLAGFFNAILLGILGGIITFFVFYFYPSSLTDGRKTKIKNDLPFAIVHMPAVAGSGAQPIDIFNQVLLAGEYPELSKEIKKVMNYVNLFGYDLSTALKAVANTTPSPDLKELLNGMTSTIATGGDLNEYLKSKADEALTTYKMDRRKYTESLSTYSEVYTSILVAAPLLFLVTLAIINAIGGNIGGMDVKTIAFIGTYLAMPLLNIGFIIFLSISQPEI